MFVKVRPVVQRDFEDYIIKRVVSTVISQKVDVLLLDKEFIKKQKWT